MQMRSAGRRKPLTTRSATTPTSAAGRNRSSLSKQPMPWSLPRPDWMTYAAAALLPTSPRRVRRAQAQLDLLAAGTRAESVTAAEADVAAARAALDQTRAALAESALRAPFAGTVASLSVNAGEQAKAGTPVVRLADLSAWEIETEDLTEYDAVQLEIGMPATVAFDAIPGLEQTGIVSIVRPIGEDKRGDIIYTAVVELDANDDRLLWNLTAVVTLDPTAR